MANNNRLGDNPYEIIAHGLEDTQIKYNRDRMVWAQSTVTPRKYEKKNMVAIFYGQERL